VAPTEQAQGHFDLRIYNTYVCENRTNANLNINNNNNNNNINIATAFCC
jgi:hypothetical protein